MERGRERERKREKEREHRNIVSETKQENCNDGGDDWTMIHSTNRVDTNTHLQQQENVQ
jgi:hypothetical protein